MNKYLNWSNYVFKINSLTEIKNEKLRKKQRIEYWKKWVDSTKGKGTPLNQLQIKEIQKYYSPYINLVDTDFHDFYYRVTGRFDVKFIPDYIYYTVVDPFFNDWNKAVHLDNKAYYDLLFYDVKRPDTIAKRCGGVWTNKDGKLITKFQLSSLLSSIKGEFFVKKAMESEGGAGVFCISPDDKEKLKAALSKKNGDIVVQKKLIQCEELNKLNPSSVNTIRIISLLNNTGVKIYSSIIRMGIKGAKVDNASSGGITCGINDDGSLKMRAYSANGVVYDKHPSTNIKFDSIKVPSFDKAIQMVKRIHPRLGHFKLVSWDIAIDKELDPVLIEANLKYGELDFHQLNNGPLFGDDTDMILKEVFHRKKRE